MEEDLTEELALLRTGFKDKYSGSISGNEYDADDVERFNTDDIYASRFYYHQKRDIDKALVMADTSLKWRKSLNLNELTDSSFPYWMHELGAVYYHNKDKDGNDVLQFKVAKSKKDPDNLQLVKTFIAWWIDKSYKKTPEKSIVVLFDMTGTGISNMDVDLIKFQITCFTTYFPYYLEYMLIYEMPWVLNAIWNIIKNLLTAEQQKRVIFVKQKDIQKYIDKDNLSVPMGGTDRFEYTYLPSEDSGIDLPSDELLTSQAESNHFSSATSGTSLRKRVTFSEKEDTQHPPADADNSECSVTPPAAPENSTIVGPMYKGTLSIISPAEQFVFNVSDASKETLDLLTLTNTTNTQVAFKVKTTTPDSYRVRPSTSLIQPGGTATVNVYLQPGNYEAINRDKFLVMMMVVEDEVTNATEISDRWKNPPQDRTKYMEHRLYCTVKHVRFDEGSTTPPKTQGVDSQLEALQKKQVQSESVLDAFHKKMGPSYSNLDSKSSEVLDVMLLQQDQLERNLSNLFKFQIFVAFLVVSVLVIFALVYVMEWRIVDSYTDLVKKSCTKQ